MKKRIVAAFLISVLIGIMLVIQARSSGGQMIYTSRKAISDYKTMIESEQETVKNINRQIEEAVQLLEQYESYEKDPETDIITQNILEEYEKYSILAGACKVRGPGVEITVDDGKRELYVGENINNLIVHDIDILMIINELKRSGAEAISVNGQRIVDSTAINCSGWTVRINGQTYARPFTIKAIGNGSRMVSNLLSQNGYGTSLREWGVIFTIEILDEVEIEAYSGNRELFYAGESGGKEKKE